LLSKNMVETLLNPMRYLIYLLYVYHKWYKCDITDHDIVVIICKVHFSYDTSVAKFLCLIHYFKSIFYMVINKHMFRCNVLLKYIIACRCEPYAPIVLLLNEIVPSLSLGHYSFPQQHYCFIVPGAWANQIPTIYHVMH
jgi:hypothetical protein